MTTTSPIDIATPTRNSSSSPSAQSKQAANYHGAKDSRTSAIMTSAALDVNGGRTRQESFAGAAPISMNNPRALDNRPRRESLAGSLVGGMSWGGVSVGSWIRDDIIMAGTSPFPYQSPSYHSSSYLPKLEANFMKDFSCCGKTLPTLHDLLQHYEEAHAQQTPQSRAASAVQQAREQTNQRPALAVQAATSVQQQTELQQRQQQNGRPGANGSAIGIPGGGNSGLTGGIQRLLQQQQQSQPSTPVQMRDSTADEMDGVEDMEMDDAIGPMDTTGVSQLGGNPPPVPQNQPSLFGQPPRPNLNLGNTTGMIHQGLRTSQPTTPATANFGFQNNPTVSSVNTPTLSALPQQQNTSFTPDNSGPGTPSEMDEDFNNIQSSNLGNANLNSMNMGNVNYGYNFGNDLGLDLCIDEPAKRLFSPNGAARNQGALAQQFAQFGIGNGSNQFGLNNDDYARRIRHQYLMQQQQQMGGIGGGANGLMGVEEVKPFRCPVIGCEKAYKNQNGLKYHKTHGHQTQQLHENGDGTFSIVNPETSAPYPGTMGMEKEKPYKCDVCGKRYKNLNGLKYHKLHSSPCNPALKLDGHLQAAGLGGLSVGVNGLPGTGEENIM